MTLLSVAVAFKWDLVFNGLVVIFYIFECLTSSALRGNESATVYTFVQRNTTFASGAFGSLLLFVSVFLSVHWKRRH